jgi:hypothetical protein
VIFPLDWFKLATSFFFFSWLIANFCTNPMCFF